MIMLHYICILQNDDEALRVEYTLDHARLVANYDQGLSDWRVIYCEAYPDLTDAMRRAKHFKSAEGNKTIKQRLRSYLWR